MFTASFLLAEKGPGLLGDSLCVSWLHLRAEGFGITQGPVLTEQMCDAIEVISELCTL